MGEDRARRRRDVLLHAAARLSTRCNIWPVASDERKKVSIRFNGQELSDVSQLPPEIRKLVEDAESKLTHHPGGVSGEEVQIDRATTTSYQVGGKTYDSLDQMPPEIRKLVEGAAQGEGDVEQIEVKSRSFKSLDEMPPELRAAAKSMLAGNPQAHPKLSVGSAGSFGSVAPVRQSWPAPSAPPPSGARPTWVVIVLSALAGALVTFLVLRH